MSPRNCLESLSACGAAIVVGTVTLGVARADEPSVSKPLSAAGPHAAILYTNASSEVHSSRDHAMDIVLNSEGVLSLQVKPGKDHARTSRTQLNYVVIPENATLLTLEARGDRAGTAIRVQPTEFPKATNRNLLFTPADAANTVVRHPLLTPEDQAKAVAIPIKPR